MRNKVRDYIHRYKMIEKGDGVLVALSGGPDSVCLLHILKSLQEEYHLKLIAMHINHQLRGAQSEADERYVRDLCDQLDISCFVRRVNIEKLSEDEGISIEEAGRWARYNCFYHIREKHNLQKIALGQHRDDNAETILMRMIRGTGTQGLGGISPHREDGVIRPLLGSSREEIEKYCRINNLSPRIDESNLKPIYFRNQLRLEVIPYLEEFNPNLKDNLNNMAEIIREQQEYVEKETQQLWQDKVRPTKDSVVLPVEWLIGLMPFIRKQMLRRAVKWVKNDLKEIEFTHIQLIIEMLESHNNTTWVLHLPQGIRAKRQYNQLIVEKERKRKDIFFEYQLPIGGKVWVSEIKKGFNTYLVKREEIDIIKNTVDKKYFDFDKVGTLLMVRNRRPGDRFHPVGMKGTKKLKDYFIDLKVPQEKRDEIPIIIGKQGILWVAGYRVDERYAIDKATKVVLAIEYLQEEEKHEK